MPTQGGVDVTEPSQQTRTRWSVGDNPMDPKIPGGKRLFRRGSHAGDDRERIWQRRRIRIGKTIDICRLERDGLASQSRRVVDQPQQRLFADAPQNRVFGRKAKLDPFK